ncbi:MAG: type III pantothenate kinase, partial [Gammaproteobacteria bacterium]|nr:type III pantothenate kinase [Gammaproteobacteria bacterium]
MNPAPVRSRTLLIDSGNTNLKWSWLEEGELSDICSLSHPALEASGSIERYWQNEPPPGKVLIANVAGGMIDVQLINWIAESWKVRAQLVRSQASALGVTNAYQIPEQLGVDRWLTLIAAHRSNSGACCIVDCGTAMTVDVIAESGRHL